MRNPASRSLRIVTAHCDLLGTHLSCLGNLGPAKGMVKFPVGEKSSVGSDLGTVELQLQSTVEIDP